MVRRRFIYFIVIIINVLLIINIALIYYNNSVIRQNREIQLEVEKTKVYFDQVAKSIIHSIDIGLRGFAIVRTERFAKPFRNAVAWKDSILHNVEVPLQKLNYDFRTYNVFKDSLNAYIQYSLGLKKLLLQNKEEEFRRTFSADRGVGLWGQYMETEKSILAFVDQINAEAQNKFENALLSNQILQVILFLVCFPTLLLTAYYTSKTIKLSEQLRLVHKERNKLLRDQNTILELRVMERTKEITGQYEEITAQGEELARQADTQALQNRQLQEAQKIIEKQNTEIQSMNDHLQAEVIDRTKELYHANQELIEQNSQLEQFAFIAAHNLRAPLARILGLANLIRLIPEEEKDLILKKMVDSTHDLDEVIKDLTAILNIKKHTGNLEAIDLKKSFELVKRMLEREIDETQATVTGNFTAVDSVFALDLYVNSILYNLISNAIKYRSSAHRVHVVVSTTRGNDFVCLSVSDNGVGIDLPRFQQDLFGLYKRFHVHVEGRGLGLYLVKTQIEAMGGRVEVTSELDKGTTFRVYFRRAPKGDGV